MKFTEGLNIFEAHLKTREVEPSVSKHGAVAG
jgi:hypothetical protein